MELRDEWEVGEEKHVRAGRAPRGHLVCFLLTPNVQNSSRHAVEAQ